MTMDLPPHLIDPPAIVAPEEVRKKRRGRRRAAATTLAVGMIIIGDDGKPCQIVSLNPDGASGYCVPVAP